MSNLLRVTLDEGPCEEKLRSYDDGTFDALITDPPYGLGDDPDVDELLESWAEGQDYDFGKGFMDSEWDTVPPPSTWEEVLRVLEDEARGGVFAGTRTVDLMMASLKLGGFVVEDIWRWTYGNGLPKSFNARSHILKKSDARYGEGERCGCEGEAPWDPSGSPDPDREQKRRVIPDDYDGKGLVTRVCSWCLLPDDDFLEALRGKGTSLKPSWEPIIVVRKPSEPRSDRDELLEAYGLR